MISETNQVPTHQLVDSESKHLNQFVVMTLNVKLSPGWVAPRWRARAEIGDVEKKETDRLYVAYLLSDVFSVALKKVITINIRGKI